MAFSAIVGVVLSVPQLSMRATFWALSSCLASMVYSLIEPEHHFWWDGRLITIAPLEQYKSTDVFLTLPKYLALQWREKDIWDFIPPIK